MTAKETLGDKALFWGTIWGAAISILGGVMWLTHIDNLATSTAEAQSRMRDNIEKKLDSMDDKLDQINGRVSHIEGAQQAK